MIKSPEELNVVVAFLVESLAKNETAEALLRALLVEVIETAPCEALGDLAKLLSSELVTTKEVIDDRF